MRHESERFMQKALINFGKFLKVKRNYMFFSTMAVGIPCALWFVWLFGSIPTGGFWWQLFLVFVAFAGAILGSLLMWEFFVKPLVSSFAHLREKSNGEGHG